MMISFLEFINEDIESKKTILSVTPTNTKVRRRKYNEKVDEISNKYKEYKKAVKKYIDVKSKSFEITSEVVDLDILQANIVNLEKVHFMLNPFNTYFEKIGFDDLLFQINNYYDFKFSSLNDIINAFLDKFEEAGIILQKSDFDYTCYVSEYMASFLDVRKEKSNSYRKVSDVFEKIYWVNPEIIEHIELNFRKLIRKHEKKFKDYVISLQKNIMKENYVASYDEVCEKLKDAYNDLIEAKKGNINEVVELAKTNQIDVTNYFEDSKVRQSTYDEVMINHIDFSNEKLMEKFYSNLEKLKFNIQEYCNYINFIPLINDFKENFSPKTSTKDNSKGKKSELKVIENQIIDKEKALNKLNKKIFGDVKNSLKTNFGKDIKTLRQDSVRMAKELYGLYKSYDQESFREKIVSVLNTSFTVADFLQLYYSFDYFKKMAIKKVFEITSFDEIVKYSETFDSFAKNPNNVIINGITLFDDNNIARIIVNKYRLSNINLKEDDFTLDDLSIFLEKIELILRIKDIENSSINMEKLWFISQAAKIEIAENKA